MKKNIDEITKDQIFRAYRIAAEIVAKYGDVYLPIFQRMHSEVEEINRNEGIKALALKLASDNMNLDGKQ